MKLYQLLCITLICYSMYANCEIILVEPELTIAEITQINSGHIDIATSSDEAIRIIRTDPSGDGRHYKINYNGITKDEALAIIREKQEELKKLSRK